jgi:dTDP-4-dehydrorhamnose reductase
VCNYYALSKLVAEEMVRLAPAYLIIRTSFRPREWPYPVAFTDVYTSQDYVDIIAPQIALAITHCHEIPYDTLHIATERKSAYELAKRRNPNVQSGSKGQTGVTLPNDISLDTTRWERLRLQWDNV